MLQNSPLNALAGAYGGYVERVIASIPSPGSGVLHLGPLTLHAYGLCIAAGVLAAVWLSTRRWTATGGSADDVTTLALWGVPAGIIGARIYHVITDNHLYRDDPLTALYLWDGGLGIWGGIAAGVAAGLWVGRRIGHSPLRLLDMVAPGLALGQAIGRLGNYFNQELFGRPTDLPWALQISPENRPAEYESFATFHPTFAYEGLWDLVLCGALILAGSRLRLKPGRLFLLYVAGYTFARFFIEGLRIDEASILLGLRVNEVVSATVFAGCLLIAVLARPNRDRRSVEARTTTSPPTA